MTRRGVLCRVDGLRLAFRTEPGSPESWDGEGCGQTKTVWALPWLLSAGLATWWPWWSACLSMGCGPRTEGGQSEGRSLSAPLSGRSCPASVPGSAVAVVVEWFETSPGGLGFALSTWTP